MLRPPTDNEVLLKNLIPRAVAIDFALLVVAVRAFGVWCLRGFLVFDAQLCFSYAGPHTAGMCGLAKHTPRTSILWPNTHPGPLYFSQTQAPDIYTLAKHTPRSSIFQSNTPPGTISRPNTPPGNIFQPNTPPGILFQPCETLL